MSIAAAAATATGLHCKVWQPQGLYETPSSSSSSYISVKPGDLFIDFYVSLNEGNDEEIPGSFGYKNFRQKRSSEDWLSWSAISWMLSQTNVPYHLQPFLIQHISIRAHRIATQPNNALSPTIPIVVDLKLPMEDNDDDSSGRCFGNGSDRPSVKDILERVDEIGDDDDDDDPGHICVICLDEISINNNGSSEYAPVRMPCFHVYHRYCIHKWLQFTNPCPLCRFHIMPKQP